MFRPDPIHPLAAKKRGPVFIPLFQLRTDTRNRSSSGLPAGCSSSQSASLVICIEVREIIGKGNLIAEIQTGRVPPSYAPISSPFLFAISRYFALFRESRTLAGQDCISPYPDYNTLRCRPSLCKAYSICRPSQRSGEYSPASYLLPRNGLSNK